MLKESIIFKNYFRFNLISIFFILILAQPSQGNSDPLTGQKVTLQSHWIGRSKVSSSLSILVLAGHADSQGIAGSGTAGARGSPGRGDEADFAWLRGRHRAG